MDNPQRSSLADDVELVKSTTPPHSSSSSSSFPHTVFTTEDPLESIFGYLDTNSLKQCRLVCCLWTPLATRFLMRKTFCVLPSSANDPEGSLHSKTSLTSVKINGALLSRFSTTKIPPSSLQRHWKSISLSLVPSSSSGIFSLVSFLNNTSSSHCPQLNHLKIQFADDPKTVPVQFPRGQPIPFCAVQQAYVLQMRFRRNPLASGDLNSNQAPIFQLPKVDPISSPLNIHSLHLVFEDTTNIPQVAAFLRVFLRYETLPNLVELVVEFSEPRLRSKPRETVRLPKPYRLIIHTIKECDDAVCNLRVLRIVGNVPLGVWSPGCPRIQHFMRKAVNSELPGVNVCFMLSNELEELQWGSGLVAVAEEGAVELPAFLPGVLSAYAASNLKMLDLSGFYLSDENRLRIPIVNFPHLPCLRKLTAEEVAIKWIKNFPSIFEKAQAIQEFIVKNSFAFWSASPFLRVEDLIDFHKWESEWGLGKYPSLRRLEFGDSIDVKHVITLRRMSKIFPNVEVLQFTCDDKSRRLRKQDPNLSCQVDFMVLQGIVEGLLEWKCLRHLKVTYWPHFSVNEMLEHFILCGAKLPALRLYDFRRSSDENPILHMEELRSHAYLHRMMQKVGQLKLSPQVVFVLQNFHCPHAHFEEKLIKRLHKCSLMEQLFQFADKAEVFNFRKGMK